ncbi:MAG: KUP/HAK/KT family potassium transporter, partial [Candidatus Altiarchaeota archaeon]|nr:KUP/HAK/KT family potassium transporter [Candidatus Altiarchaeota archaeon]
KSSRGHVFFTILTLVGVSLLIGDGVITPAISILSAVEGMALVPGLEAMSQGSMVVIAIIIAVALFTFQKRGSDKVSRYFGPIMFLWFSVLAISGLASILVYPQILGAVNPLYAIEFLLQNGLLGFFILSEVILCATGGEALYADMGHLGRRPILKAWLVVFLALLLNYLGQGVFIMQNPEAHGIFFEMIFSQVGILYLPLLVLTILATIIASQAMISGMFSIVYQGITTGLLPKLKVEYTSIKLKSQIYVPVVNWFLMLAVIFIMFFFGSSGSLSSAYGLAVTGSMTITGMVMTSIFYLRHNNLKFLVALLVTLVNVVYLASTSMKIPMGGYWSILISSVPFSLITIYMLGQRRVQKSLKLVPMSFFIQRYKEFYKSSVRIPGRALFFVKNVQQIPQYMVRVIFQNNILYDENVLVSLVQKDEPYGIHYGFKEPLAPGLKQFEIEYGYMEVLDLTHILKKSELTGKAIFYGVEEIHTTNPVWKVFSIIKRLTPSSVRFYKLPAEKLHGVILRIDIDREFLFENGDGPMKT